MNSHPNRIGIGYDIHRLIPKRKLMLGGVEIPSAFGLEGHSDGDCLTHAIADAILGACGLPDIGHQFPNTDPKNKGIDSQIILKKAQDLASKFGYHVGNVDTCIIAEKPKISPYIYKIKSVLAKTLEISTSQVGIKATTHEKIGSLGAAEGIAAHAVCIVYSV